MCTRRAAFWFLVTLCACDVGNLPLDSTGFACSADQQCGAQFRCVAGVCRAEASCSTQERCDDSVDNDCDAVVDCADTDCLAECSVADGGVGDAGAADGGSPDAGASDAGASDAGASDAGANDAGASDAGASDAGAGDAGANDAGASDAGGVDAGVDAGPVDAGLFLTPSSFHFLGVLPARGGAAPANFTLTNRNAFAVTPAFAVSSADAGFAVLSSTCPTSLAPDQSCTVSVGFDTVAVGDTLAFLDVSAPPAGTTRAQLRALGLPHAGYVGPLALLRPASSLPTTGGIAYNPTTKRIRITQHDAGLDNIDLRGAWVTVEANNVTIRNCLADVAATPFYVIDQYAVGSGLIVEDCDFDGLKANNITAAFVTGRNGFVTVRRNYMHDAPSDMVKISSGVVTGNFFARAGYTSGAHADAIQSGGPGPLSITDNYFDWRAPTDLDGGAGTNSAVIVQPGGLSVDDLLIDRNVAFGGSSTFNVAPQSGAPYVITNARITNNRFAFWTFYALYPVNVPPTLVFSGNTHFLTGAPITWP